MTYKEHLEGEIMVTVNTLFETEYSYEDADIVVFGAPFDSTTSYRPGTRFASRTMRAESYGLEYYSPGQDFELTDVPFFDAGDLNLSFGDTKQTLNIIENYTAEVMADDKFPLMIGGEHLLTLAPVSVAFRKYRDLAIIHFDAHADLRDEYLKVKLSHATVVHRIYDLLGENSIYQFGIRSGDKAEFEYDTYQDDVTSTEDNSSGGGGSGGCNSFNNILILSLCAVFLIKIKFNKLVKK